MDYGVHFGVNSPAKLIVLAGRNTLFLADAIPQVDTVGGLPRCAIIAGADYLIVFDDYRAESAPEARAPHCHSTGDIHVILAFRRSFHFCPMSYDPHQTLVPDTAQKPPHQGPESGIRRASSVIYLAHQR